jgi:hypothetical protein
MTRSIEDVAISPDRSDQYINAKSSSNMSMQNANINTSSSRMTSSDPSTSHNNTSSDHPKNIERMFETFHQSPHGDFRPSFYNPFEVKHRRRTTRAQYKVLEKVFLENCKPPAGLRRQIASKLGMTPRSVQVWFQNRRAKMKTQQSKSMQVPGLSRSASSSDLSLLTAISEENSEQQSPTRLVNSTTNECEESDEGATSDPNGDYTESERLVDDGGCNENENSNKMRPRSNSCPSINHRVPCGTINPTISAPFSSLEQSFKQLQDALFGSYYPTPTVAPPTTVLMGHAPQAMYPVYTKTSRSQSQPAIPPGYHYLLPGSVPYHHPIPNEQIADDHSGQMMAAALNNYHQQMVAAGNLHIYYPHPPPPTTVNPNNIQPVHLQPPPPAPCSTLNPGQPLTRSAHSLPTDPVDFDYMLQSNGFADQWLYLPHNSQAHQQIGEQVHMPPDAFLMSFVDDIEGDGQFVG